jgi:hypothetical protein
MADASRDRNGEPIRKGQVRWIGQGDVAEQAMFVGEILGLNHPVTAASK